MIVFFNGQFLPEEQARVSIHDRSFLYGDGLFETVRIYRSVPFRLDAHLERLRQGADFLAIKLPFSIEELARIARELISRNQCVEGVLRIQVSRGPGPRGFSPRGADQPLVVLTIHPPPRFDRSNPPQLRLATASMHLPAHDSLARFKTCNKLHQIQARLEAEANGADEALFLNSHGQFSEAASANLFYIENGAVCTPPIETGILPGITRGIVLQLCQSLNLTPLERPLLPGHVSRLEGMFLTSSVMELVEAVALDTQPLPQSPLTKKLQAAYQDLVLREIEQGRSG